MARLDSPHTRSTLIAALSNRGHWEGQRAGVAMRIELEAQMDTEGQRIHWTAYKPGDYRHRKHGHAGTVHEALAQIAQAIRGKV